MGLATNASTVGQRAAVLRLLKKIEDCAATAVLNKLDVREGSQGDIHPISILLPLSLSKVFLLPTSLRALPGHPGRSIFLEPCPTSLSYFDTGAGAVVLGAGTVVLGAGVAFTAAVLGAGFAGAAEL